MELLAIIISGFFSFFVAITSVWFKHYLDNRKKNKEEEYIENINNDIDDIVEIQNYINTFRDKNNFDRLLIYQFHNGGKFFYGIPMKKFSQTFESVANGISKMKNYNDFLITKYPLFIKSISENNFLELDNENYLDYDKNLIINNGIIQMIIIPIRTLSDQLIGFIEIHLIKNKIKITDELKEQLLYFSSKISGFLIKNYSKKNKQIITNFLNCYHINNLRYLSFLILFLIFLFLLL